MRYLCLLFLLTYITSVHGQDVIVDLTEMPDMEKSDISIGQKAIVTFFSKSDNMVISSSTQSDIIGSVEKQSDGQYATEVTCDLSQRGISKSRKFEALIKGTTLKGSIKKILTPEKRYFFQVTEAEHVLTPWWPETKDVLYRVEGKAAIEFNIPQGIDNLQVKYCDNIGGKVMRSTGKGVNLITLEIDCSLLQKKYEDIELKTKQADAIEKKLTDLKLYNQNKFNEEGFDIDKAEEQEKELELELEQLRGSIPHLYVVLYGDNTNQVPVPQEMLKKLLEKKYKLTMGVNDALQKTVVGTTPLAEKLKSANLAYQGRRFKEALIFYQQASEEPEATEVDKNACNGWIETINKCIDAQTEANKALLLLKNYKEKGGDVNPDKIVELFNIAISNYRTLFFITKNEFYQNRIENYEKSRDKIGYVMSGVVVSTDFKQGILYESPITGIDIYGVKETFNKEMKKGVHGDLLGSTNDDGQFHLEVPREMYEGLLFVPAHNKEFSKNVWQKLRGSTHLDIKIRFSKD